MRKAFILFFTLCVLCSCGTTSSALYYWGGEQKGTTTYENLAYADYKTQTPEAICNLICAYQDMVSNPGGSRQVPPPGICAEYGYLLLQPSTAQAFQEKATDRQKVVFPNSDYQASFPELGLALLKKEIEYYPESRKFLEPLIQKLEQ